MGTLFGRVIGVWEESESSYAKDGSFVPGTLTLRRVVGTIQPMSGEETVPAVAASRNTGTVKIYSSSALRFRKRGNEGRGFVKYGHGVYEIVDEIPNRNGIISHWKYVACLVPAGQEPESLQ